MAAFAPAMRGGGVLLPRPLQFPNGGAPAPATPGEGSLAPPRPLSSVSRVCEASSASPAVLRDGVASMLSGSSASSLRSGSSSIAWRPSRFEGPGGPSTTVAKQAAVVAAELCQDIRHLRESMALATSCDAVLATRVQGLCERKPPKAVQHKSSAFKLVHREEIHWATFLRQTCFQLWYSISKQRKALAALLVKGFQPYICLGVLHQWWCIINASRLDRAVTELEAECFRINDLADQQLSQLQSRYLQMKLAGTLKHMKSFAEYQESAIVRSALLKWASIVQRARRNQEQVDLFLRTHTKIADIQCQCSVKQVMEAWQEFWGAGRRKAEARTTTIKLMAQSETLGENQFLHALMLEWSHQASRAARLQRLQLSSMSEQSRMHSELMTAKQRAKQANVERFLKSASVNRAQTAEGLFNFCFYAWRRLSKLAILEREVEYRACMVARLDRTMGKLRPSPAQCPLASSLVRLVEIKRQLVFLEWHRAARFSLEHGKLGEALSEEQRLQQNLSRMRIQLREEQMKCACGHLESFMAVQIPRVKHDALEQWKLGTVRATVTLLRSQEQRQRNLAEEVQLEVDALHGEVRRQRARAVHALGCVAERSLDMSAGLLYSMWAEVTYEEKLERQREQRREKIMIAQSEIKSKQQGWKLKRRATATEVAGIANRKFFQANVLNSWHIHTIAQRTEREMLNINESAKSLDKELQRMTARKQQALFGSMQAWVEENLGVAALSHAQARLILREWRAAVRAAAILRENTMLRKSVQHDVIDLCEQSINFTDKVCLIRALLSFRLVRSMSVEQQEHCELEALKIGHLRTLRRMSGIVRMRLEFGERSDNMTLALHVFGEWRCTVGTYVTERTRLLACTDLDHRLARARSDLIAENRILEGLLDIARKHVDIIQLRPALATLCFFAWRWLPAVERRRRAAMKNEEQALESLNRLHGQMSESQSRWFAWVASAQFLAKMHHASTELFEAWRCTARRTRQMRADVVAGASALRAADSQQGCRTSLLQHAFSKWQIWQRCETVNGLEEEVRRLEMRVVDAGGEGELAILSEPSVSSSSEDESAVSEWSVSAISPYRQIESRRQQQPDDVRLEGSFIQADLDSGASAHQKHDDNFQGEEFRRSVPARSPLYESSYIGSSPSAAYLAQALRPDFANDFGNDKDASTAAPMRHSLLGLQGKTGDEDENASLSQFAAQLSRFKFGLDRPL